MARYSEFLGRLVEVQYRAGDICVPASGRFVADSGRSILLEQHFEQHGNSRNFRWEIPYQYIVRIEEPSREIEPQEQPAAEPEPVAKASMVTGLTRTPKASAARAGGGSSLVPLQHRPKTA